MKKIFLCLIIIALSLSALSCADGEKTGGDPSSRDKVPNPEILPESAVGYSDFNGLYFELTEITRVGYSDILTVDLVNDTDYTVTYGKAYTVERLDGGEWTDVTEKSFDVPEIACIIEPHSKNEEQYSTEYFNMSKLDSRYRLVIEAYVQRGEVSDGTSVVLEFYAGEEADYGESYTPSLAVENLKNSVRVEQRDENFALNVRNVEYRDNSFASLPKYFYFDAQITNTSEEDIILYIPYDIQRFEYGRWYSTLSADIDYYETERVLAAGQSAEYPITTDGYDLTKPGLYRICKRYKTASDPTPRDIYILFELSD